MILYTERLNYKLKLAEFISFPFCAVFSVVVLQSQNNFSDYMLAFIGVVLSSITFFPWLNRLIGYKKISVDGKCLVITNHLCIKYKTVSYELDKIYKPVIKLNDKAKSYSGLVTFEFFGYSRVPKDLRNYDINPVTLHFSYGKKKVIIGEGLKPFEGKEIIDVIKSTKKNKVQ